MGAREVLQSWKDIAAYVGRDVRTCRRWEENFGLPIHRLDGSPKARVMAYKDEIDWWLDAKLHEHDPGPAPPPRPTPDDRVVRVFGLPVPASVASFPRRYLLIGFTAVMAVGVLGWRALNNGRPRYVPNGRRPTIAVLPFVNGTGDAGLDYLRESVPDHLVRDLQRSNEHLKVYSFDAVIETVRKLGFEPGAPLTPAELAAVSERLGAGWLVFGYFARSGAKIRVDYGVREVRAPTPVKTEHVPGTEGEMTADEHRNADGVRAVFDVPVSAGPETFALSVRYLAAELAEQRHSRQRHLCRPDPQDLWRPRPWVISRARSS